MLLCPKLFVEGQAPPKSSFKFIQELAQHMMELDFTTASRGTDHSVHQEYLPNDLMTCSHVWVRVDRIQRPLEAPYKGPLRVVHRSAKTFRVELPSGTTDTVSVDRLKPAYFPSSESCTPRQSAVPPEDQLRSGGAPSPPHSTLQSASADLPEAPAQEPQRTRSGRKVRFRPEPDFVYI